MESSSFSLVVAASLLIFTSWITFQLFLHPLAKFPGPKLASLTYFPLMTWMTGGRFPYVLQDLHAQYGHFVRVGPNTISVSSVKGLEDIYGSRPLFTKGAHYKPFAIGKGKERSLGVDTDVAHHTAQRAMINPVFMGQNLFNQEPLIQGHLSTMFKKLTEHIEDSSGIDMSFWAFAFASDIIGDLAFGESFGSLENEKLHWVVETLGSFFKSIVVVDCLRRFPRLMSIFMKFVPKKVLEGRRRLTEYSENQLKRRLASTDTREDFITILRRAPPDKRPNDELLRINAVGFIIAGGETTSTAIASALYFVWKTPGVYHRLSEEVRGAFASTEDITARATDKLKYLQGVINETLRIYPPVAAEGFRESPGAFIDGKYMPEGTEVFAPYWVLQHDPANFKYPSEFRPERWLDDSFQDQKKASQPFSLGPRNCIGRMLALIEIRLVVAKLMYEFDYELANKEFDLLQESTYMFQWRKPPVYLKLSKRLPGTVGDPGRVVTRIE